LRCLAQAIATCGCVGDGVETPSDNEREDRKREWGAQRSKDPCRLLHMKGECSLHSSSRWARRAELSHPLTACTQKNANGGPSLPLPPTSPSARRLFTGQVAMPTNWERCGKATETCRIPSVGLQLLRRTTPALLSLWRPPP